MYFMFYSNTKRHATSAGLRPAALIIQYGHSSFRIHVHSTTTLWLRRAFHYSMFWLMHNHPSTFYRLWATCISLLHVLMNAQPPFDYVKQNPVREWIRIWVDVVCMTCIIICRFYQFPQTPTQTAKPSGRRGGCKIHPLPMYIFACIMHV